MWEAEMKVSWFQATWGRKLVKPHLNKPAGCNGSQLYNPSYSGGGGRRISRLALGKNITLSRK
jgi:hypothetical protein